MQRSMTKESILLLGMSVSFLYGRLLASPTREKRLAQHEGGTVMIELWADKVIGFSTQYDSDGFSALRALGSADVYPDYGDVSGAWTPHRDHRDSKQYIDVGFAEAVFLRKVDIFETFHAGGVTRLSARSTDNEWHTLYQNDTVTLIEQSRIFSPRINIPFSAVDAIRINTDCTGQVVEIDAIKIRGLREMAQLWADNVINVSSEYDDTRYAAKRALKKPDVYPEHGDNNGSWAQAVESIDDSQYIEVGFAETLFLRVVDIYETWHSGGVRKLSARTPDNQWQTIYQNNTVTVIDHSRIFSPRITVPSCLVDAIRVDVNCTSANGFVEIDAIIIYGLRECSQGKWGSCCEKNCGMCFDHTQCTTRTGVCPKPGGKYRCAAGYKGFNCDQACDAGTFGADCEHPCGNCINGKDTCAKESGNCPSIASTPSCMPGFQGNLCKNETSPQSSYTGTTAAIGGGVGALVAMAIAAIVVKIRKSSKDAYDINEASGEFHVVTKGDHDPGPRLGSGQRARDTEYCNVVAIHNGLSTVPVDEFEAHVQAKRASDGFSTEYENLPKGLQANFEAATKPKNTGKNRYQNIVAYDHSRVVLVPLDDDPNSDYINACYVHGYKEENKYVASQGPTPIIINDFWRTIWQVDTGKIVMLTNLIEDRKVKSEHYWPKSVLETVEFGQMRIKLLAEDKFDDFTVRALHVTNKKYAEQAKEITQFHFTAWPDHGVPTRATGLLNFHEKVNANKTKLSGPLFVHCSAGIGRTGTFIGLDYLIKQASEDGVVDVPACVRSMRQQRTNMIQTEGQYNFLYDALIEALRLSICSVLGTMFPSVYREICIEDPDTGQTKLQQQFQVLMDISPALTKTDFKASLDPANKPKNRSMKIMAAESARTFLSMPLPGANDYINAVFIPAYKKKRAFIITHMPLPGTVIDFWRLIYEQDVRTVIMLNTMDQVQRDPGIYWPEKSRQYGPFDVETLEVEDGNFYKTRTLQLKYKKGQVPKQQAKIKQFQCTFWPDDELVPRYSAPLITLIEEVERWQQKTGNGPIIVHCMDGATRSGLYCAVSSIIERLKVYQEVNILQTIKQMRTNRPEIINNLDQFHFIHKVVLAYLENFKTYANC